MTHVRVSVGGLLFELDPQLLVHDDGSILADVVRSCREGGGEASIPRSGALFSQIVTFLATGELPNDVVVLRDLYVESAFYRLASLRDAIEAQLMGGGGAAEVGAALAGAASRTTPTLLGLGSITSGSLASSAPQQRQSETLLAAASALSKAGAVQRAVASIPPPKPSMGMQTEPPRVERPLGLTTTEYVGGNWRKLYASGSAAATPVGAGTPQRPSASSRSAASSPARSISGQHLQQRQLHPPVSPAKAAFQALQRAAQSTALPDPFGFTSRKWPGGEEEEVLAQPGGGGASEDGTACSGSDPDATPALSGSITRSIQALAFPDNVRGCNSTLDALTSLLSRTSEQHPPLAQQESRPPLRHPLLPDLEAARSLIARAMELTGSPPLTQLAPPAAPPPATQPPHISLVLPPPMNLSSLPSPPPLRDSAVRAPAAFTAPSGSSIAGEEKDGGGDGDGEVGGSVSSLLSALSAIRAVSGGTVVSLAGLQGMALLNSAASAEGKQGGEGVAEPLPSLSLPLEKSTPAGGEEGGEAPLTLSPSTRITPGAEWGREESESHPAEAAPATEDAAAPSEEAPTGAATAEAIPLVTHS
jgi:hypothetical protein